RSRLDLIRERFMAEALRLAERGRYGVAPNPLVGAVVVSRGEVTGRGYHRRQGGPPAGGEALRPAGPRAPGARPHRTPRPRAAPHAPLAPGAPPGKPPPAPAAILQAGVARVFFGARDPNPLTAGRGPRRLAREGVVVAGGILAREAREQNRAYFHWRRTGRPW